MRKYKVILSGKEFELPVIPISDTKSIAVFDMLSSSILSSCAVGSIVSLLKEERVEDFDTVVSAETKGVILAHGVAAQMGNKEMVIFRKEQKFYHRDPIKAVTSTYTTSGKHYLYLDREQVSKISNKRVLIVDDVVSTGNSLNAMESVINSFGGIVVGRVFVFAEGDAYKRADVKFVSKLPIMNSVEEDYYE